MADHLQGSDAVRVVRIDRPERRNAIDSDTDPAAVPIPYIHEAGHTLGLSHVEDPGQLMHTTPGPDTQMNEGDREGIRRLAAQPCA